MLGVKVHPKTDLEAPLLAYSQADGQLPRHQGTIWGKSVSNSASVYSGGGDKDSVYVNIV
jgi:hypothetical protein